MADEETRIPLSGLDAAECEETGSAGSGAGNETAIGIESGTGSGAVTDSGGQNAGLKKHDLEARKAAARPAAMRRLRKLRISTLQRGPNMRDHFSTGIARTDKEGILDCPFSDKELQNFARPIIESRMSGERNYLDRLRKACVDAHGDVWQRKFALPKSDDESYEKWLKAGDPFAEFPFGIRGTWSLYQSLSEDFPNATSVTHSVYWIDPSALADCGILMLSDMSLHTICELGNHLRFDPAFFIGHVCSTSPWPRGGWSEFANETRVRWVNIVGSVAKGSNASTNFVFDVGARPKGNGSARNYADQQCDLRFSCIWVKDSFLVVAFDTPPVLLPAPSDNASSAAMRLPVIEAKHTSFRGSHCIAPGVAHLLDFFFDIWAVRRLSDIWAESKDSSSPGLMILWLWAVWLYERHIHEVVVDLQEIDYQSVTLLTSEALDRIKNGRASVALLRRNLAQTKQAIAVDFFANDAYRGAASVQKLRAVYSEDGSTDGAQHASKDISPTPRELAASSIEEEYAWLDKQAADLMPRLNENLQVVIATLNVEQSKVALEVAELSRRDAEVSRRNGERSTQLTLLAAIYLPLTLATGIFGMNIRDINSDEVRYWWPIILAIVLMIPSAVVIAYIFWRSRQDRRRESERIDKGEKEA